MLDYLKAWLALNLVELKADRRGVTALEYGLIAMLIAVAAITGITAFGTHLNDVFTNLTTKF